MKGNTCLVEEFFENHKTSTSKFGDEFFTTSYFLVRLVRNKIYKKNFIEI